MHSVHLFLIIVFQFVNIDGIMDIDLAKIHRHYISIDDTIRTIFDHYSRLVDFNTIFLQNPLEHLIINIIFQQKLLSILGLLVHLLLLTSKLVHLFIRNMIFQHLEPYQISLQTLLVEPNRKSNYLHQFGLKLFVIFKISDHFRYDSLLAQILIDFYEEVRQNISDDSFSFGDFLNTDT